jgi:hypothetical protein
MGVRCTGELSAAVDEMSDGTTPSAFPRLLHWQSVLGRRDGLKGLGIFQIICGEMRSKYVQINANYLKNSGVLDTLESIPPTQYDVPMEGAGANVARY